MINENNEITKLKAECDLEMKSLRAELREIKFRETRLFADYSELEEENISLQKQVSVLKSSQVILLTEISHFTTRTFLYFRILCQVEFEGAKHEIQRLQEDVEVYQQQVEELTKLKKIAEKQMEEALESLQVGIVLGAVASHANNAIQKNLRFIC